MIVCAGQEPLRELADELEADAANKARVHIVGGALKAAELDARYAIREGSLLAGRL